MVFIWLERCFLYSPEVAKENREYSRNSRQSVDEDRVKQYIRCQSSAESWVHHSSGGLPSCAPTTAAGSLQRRVHRSTNCQSGWSHSNHALSCLCRVQHHQQSQAECHLQHPGPATACQQVTKELSENIFCLYNVQHCIAVLVT